MRNFLFCCGVSRMRVVKLLNRFYANDNCYLNESISLEAVRDAGFDTFKVVARQATHTILAACSSEQQKCSTSSSCSVCFHSDNTPQSQNSTLMPNCCRQCFYAFVNNVVSSTMMEKVGCA